MAHTPTTGAIVKCEAFIFGDGISAFDPGLISMNAQTETNGRTDAGEMTVPPAAPLVTFPRNATRAVKATAVKNAVNALVQSYEPGIPLLTDADIQISGLPI